MVEAAEQTLRVFRILAGGLVAASEQLSREIDLGAIDGKQPMSQPGVAAGLRSIGGKDFLVGALENRLVELLASHTERRGRDAVFLR